MAGKTVACLLTALLVANAEVDPRQALPGLAKLGKADCDKIAKAKSHTMEGLPAVMQSNPLQFEMLTDFWCAYEKRCRALRVQNSCRALRWRTGRRRHWRDDPVAGSRSLSWMAQFVAAITSALYCAFCCFLCTVMFLGCVIPSMCMYSIGNSQAVGKSVLIASFAFGTMQGSCACLGALLLWCVGAHFQHT